MCCFRETTSKVREWRLQQSASARRELLFAGPARARQGPRFFRLARVQRRRHQTHEHDHREHRAGQLRRVPRFCPGRPREGPLPGRGGYPPPNAGLRGDRHHATGHGRARDVHGPKAVVRGRRGADIPGPLAEDRAARGRRARRRPARQALLPARPGRQARPGRRAALGHRGRPRDAAEAGGCRRPSTPRASARRRPSRSSRRRRRTTRSAEERAARETVPRRAEGEQARRPTRPRSPRPRSPSPTQLSLIPKPTTARGGSSSWS